MMSYQITCVLIGDDPINRLSIEEYVNKVSVLKLVASFENFEVAYSFLMEKEIDLILLDTYTLEVPGRGSLTGIIQQPFVIFFSKNPMYTTDCFDLKVFDYILKPFEFERFSSSIAHLQKIVLSRKKAVTELKCFGGKFPIKNNNRIHLVPYDEIIMIKSDREYVKITTVLQVFVYIQPLKEVLSKLPQSKFVRVQKSYIVNIDYIEAVEVSKIIIKGSAGEIPIGSGFRDDLLHRLGLS